MDYARLIVLAFACSAVVCEHEVRGDVPKEDEPETDVFFGKNDSPVKECRVSLELGGPDSTVDWRIRDVKRLKELFLNPLANATRDPMPAAYVIMGTITVTRKDGSTEHFYVFSPQGYIKRARDEAYLIADLDLLFAAFTQALKDGIKTAEWLESSD